MTNTKSAEEIANYLTFTFEVLNEKGTAMTFPDAVHLIRSEGWRLSEMPPSYYELTLELLIKFGLAVTVEVNQGSKSHRGICTIDGVDPTEELDITEIEELDLKRFRARLTAQHKATEAARKAASIQAHLDYLERQLARTEKYVTRCRLTLKRQIRTADDLGERIKLGVTRKETAGAYERSTRDVANAELKLERARKLLAKKRREITAFKRQHGLAD